MRRTSILNRRTAMTVCVLMTAAVSMVGAWLVLFPTPRFPWPTGPHGVGARLYAWTDATRLEPFTPEPGDHRRLVARIWYPTSADGPRQPYIDHDEVTAALARHLHMPSMLLGRLRRAPTHAVQDARPDGGTYPVLVNPTGFSGFQAASLFWIEELVSHGYVVVTLDQPGTAAAFVWTDGAKVPLADKAVFDRYMPLALSVEPDPTPEMNGVPLPGGIIPFLADDLSFTLDQLRALNQVDPVLARTLDLDRVGVLGMSLGGYVAPEACHRDQRFKACLAVDAGKSQVVARDGLRQPLMIISRDANVMRAERAKAGGWPEPEIAHTIASQRALFEHNRADAYYVTMNGMHHVNWTDAPLWSPLVRWTGLAGPIDPYRGFALTNDCARSFFDRYLKQDPTARICGDAAGQPDIRLDTRPIGSGADATSVAPAP